MRTASGTAPRRTSARKASKPDTEFHGVRPGVTQSRPYALRAETTARPSSSARSQKSFYSVELRGLLRGTPCRACFPTFLPCWRLALNLACSQLHKAPEAITLNRLPYRIAAASGAVSGAAHRTGAGAAVRNRATPEEKSHDRSNEAGTRAPGIARRHAWL